MIVLGNGVALTGIYYNRGGEPDANITLTQRELRLPYYSGFIRENSGLSFTVEWRVANDNLNYASHWNYPNWLDETKLKDLGFDTNIPKTASQADTQYDKMLPREVYVVLEYNGPTSLAHLKRVRDNLKQQQQLVEENPTDPEHRSDLKQAEAALDNEENSFSHLFAIDAGVDKGELRQKYPNRGMYIIAAAQIRIIFIAKNKTSPPRLGGQIQALSIDSITAPYAIRRQLEPYLANNAYTARQNIKYDVSVAYGKRLEPWITGFKIIRPANK